MEFKRPLYYFTFPGIIISIIGLVLGLNFFSEYLTGNTYQPYPTVLAILLTCSGGFLALTGILLDSMSKMLSKLTNERINGTKTGKTEDINLVTEKIGQ